MNKGRRNEIQKLKYHKRLKKLQLDPLKLKEHNNNCYRTTGKPCSCFMCSPHKYSRKVKHKSKED